MLFSSRTCWSPVGRCCTGPRLAQTSLTRGELVDDSGISVVDVQIESPTDGEHWLGLGDVDGSMDDLVKAAHVTDLGVVFWADLYGAI